MKYSKHAITDEDKYRVLQSKIPEVDCFRTLVENRLDEIYKSPKMIVGILEKEIQNCYFVDMPFSIFNKEAIVKNELEKEFREYAKYREYIDDKDLGYQFDLPKGNKKMQKLIMKYIRKGFLLCDGKLNGNDDMKPKHNFIGYLDTTNRGIMKAYKNSNLSQRKKLLDYSELINKASKYYGIKKSAIGKINKEDVLKFMINKLHIPKGEATKYMLLAEYKDYIIGYRNLEFYEMVDSTDEDWYLLLLGYDINYNSFERDTDGIELVLKYEYMVRRDQYNLFEEPIKRFILDNQQKTLLYILLEAIDMVQMNKIQFHFNRLYERLTWGILTNRDIISDVTVDKDSIYIKFSEMY